MKRLLFFSSILAAGLVTPEGHAGFRYADSVATTGGQFSGSYPPSNLVNNGFVSPTNTIDTRADYLAAGNNYATASGTTANFDLTFNFNEAVSLSGMHVWNYAYRNGTGGASSTNNGVNAYTLAFYSATNGAGGLIGSFSGNLSRASWNALNPAQTINFNTTNAGVRSVVMHINSSYGGSSFVGMNELAFESSSGAPPVPIISFTASTNLVAYGKVAKLTWQVGSVTNLVINNGLGSVLLQTTNGVGSLEISPTNGYVTYTVTANGVFSNSVSLIGLPAKEKLHIYLLLGQSNMEGWGTPYDSALDAPQARVLQFGSRDGMESQWLQAHHPLTSLSAGTSFIGMGLEFAKTMLASNSEPGVVIGLINHALGATAIQWWAPGAVTTKGATHYLYDEALQRARAAAAYGVIKGVLWHQGEYNSNTNNSNPLAEPQLYAQRLQALVENLRADLGIPGLPFICGRFVPQWTNASGTVFVAGTLHQRDVVEAVLDDLHNQRSNTDCADNAGLIGREDQTIHFDAASQRELGRRYAHKMLKLYADPYRLYMGGFYAPTDLTNAAIVDPLADNDGDGEVNFMEYAFKTRPDSAADVQHLQGGLYRTNLVGVVVSYPAVMFRKRLDTEAPSHVVEVSNDLLTWRTNQPGQSPETISVDPAILNTDGTQTVTVRYHQAVESGQDRVFLRLRVSQP